MKINGIKTNIFKDIIIPATKRVFSFKKVDLVRQPAADTVEVSLLKENFQGISSKCKETVSLRILRHKMRISYFI